jgi:2-methylcitrate synthase
MSDQVITLPAARKKSVQLSGLVAGSTAISTVDTNGKDLRYRGYDINDLAHFSTFEEVAYLLIHGEMPNQLQFSRYKAQMKAMRGLPAPVRAVLEQIPAAAHPMDVLRTGCSILGTVLPEKDDMSIEGARHIADRLLATFPSMLLYWYHYARNGFRINLDTGEDSIAAHFLHLLTQAEPIPTHVHALDVSLIL